MRREEPSSSRGNTFKLPGNPGKAVGTARTGKPVCGTTVKVVGMVKIQLLGTMGSQALLGAGEISLCYKGGSHFTYQALRVQFTD